MPPRARNIEVPSEIATREDLASPNFTYACALELETATTHSAEQWARALFGDAPRLLRAFVVAGWIGVLGLRLGPRQSDQYVFGWTVESNSPELIVLGTGSFMLTARLVIRATDKHVTHVTFVRYERGIARVVWPVAAAIHRPVVRFLLRRAATVTGGPGPSRS